MYSYLTQIYLFLRECIAIRKQSKTFSPRSDAGYSTCTAHYKIYVFSCYFQLGFFLLPIVIFAKKMCYGQWSEKKLGRVEVFFNNCFRTKNRPTFSPPFWLKKHVHCM